MKKRKKSSIGNAINKALRKSGIKTAKNTQKIPTIQAKDLFQEHELVKVYVITADKKGRKRRSFLGGMFRFKVNIGGPGSRPLWQKK